MNDSNKEHFIYFGYLFHIMCIRISCTAIQIWAIIVRWIDNCGSSIGKRTNFFHKTSYVITSKKVKEKEKKKK